MKYLKVAIILCLTAVVGCSEKTISEDSCQQLDQADKQMLAIIEEIKNEYRTDERFLSKLNMSQVYWTQYRNRHLEMLYPLKRKEYKTDDWEQFANCECAEMTKLTNERILQLGMWLSGPNPYPECPNSIK